MARAGRYTEAEDAAIRTAYEALGACESHQEFWHLLRRRAKSVRSQKAFITRCRILKLPPKVLDVAISPPFLHRGHEK